MVERASGGGRRNGARWTPARARTLHVAGGRPTLSHGVSDMTIAGALQATARWSARALGRESFVVRSVRPAYETLLEYVSRGRGVHCTINVRPGDVYIKILVKMHPDSWALTGHSRSSAEELLVEIKRTPIALRCQRDPLGAHGMVCLE